MNVADIATTAIAANHAQTTRTMTNAMIKQQHAAEQAIGRMLEQAITQSGDTSGADGIDITV